jgi:hypothetical protein
MNVMDGKKDRQIGEITRPAVSTVDTDTFRIISDIELRKSFINLNK